jgi:RNA polymerase sigma-70 factor (ECF subfamily)
MMILDDSEIVELAFRRDETAVQLMQERYGRLCMAVAKRILPDERDAEECAGDAFLHAWNSIPPERPESLRAYLARIVRNLALDRYDYNGAQRRSTALTDAFEELEQSICDTGDGPEISAERQEFRSFINRFLRAESKEARVYFIRRYWYGQSISEIARECGAGTEKVKSSLFRTRSRLREAMKKEDISI